RFGVLLLLAFTAGCNNQDREALQCIAKKVQTRTETLSGTVKTSASATWLGGGESSGAESRVAARLRWDKELAETTIEVVASGKGVELRGKVRNLEQHRRAVMLADTTQGVDGVMDSLTECDH